jgi:hypothetical protein
LSQSHFDIRVAGWAGAALAAIVVVGFSVLRMHQNPIALGVNIHLLIITPLIVLVFYLGAQDTGRMLFASAYRGTLVTIFLVGCALTAFSRRGFIGIEGLPTIRRWSYSLILLAASAITIAWSFSSARPTSIAIAIPIMALFGLHRLLVARWLDGSGQSNALFLLGPGTALPDDPPNATT